MCITLSGCSLRSYCDHDMDDSSRAGDMNYIYINCVKYYRRFVGDSMGVVYVCLVWK